MRTDLAHGPYRRDRGRRELLRHHHIRGQRDLGAARDRLFEQRTRGVEHVGFVQRLADRDPVGGEERIGDAATDDQFVDLAEQRF